MAGPTHFVASPSSRRHVRQPEPPDRGVPLPPGRHAPVLALRGQGPLPRDQCGRRLRVLRSVFGDEHAEGPHTGMLINYSKRSRSFTVGFAAPLDLPDRAAACVRRSCLVVTMNPQPRAPPGAPFRNFCPVPETRNFPNCPYLWAREPRTVLSGAVRTSPPQHPLLSDGLSVPSKSVFQT